jgi:isoprenylcysteine carboxyl methyltransferase (ICMT) family protein YpbQ
MTLPKSVSSIPINVAGLSSFMLALFFCISFQVTDYWSTNITVIVLLLSLALPIIVLESIFKRPPLLSFLKSKHSSSATRVLIKLIALYVTWGMVAVIYWVFPEYRKSFYQPFWNLLFPALPWLFGLAIPYFWIVDRRMEQPEDRYFSFGSWLLRKKSFDKPLIIQLLLGWLIKVFFFPLMVVYFIGNIHLLIDKYNSWALITQNFQHFYDFSYLMLFTIDLVFAVVGYMLTLRLLDSHIRSAEPTMQGWFSALICYPPFLGGVSSLYLAYNMDNYTWGAWLNNYETAYVIWGSIILLSLSIYSFSTVMFGIRFSNLTHRGIITNGPYRYTKHPAYLSKNLTWWMISIPFISQLYDIGEIVRSCLMLLLLNLIYYVRAKTEENHLLRDPIYCDYANWMADNGLIARMMLTLK